MIGSVSTNRRANAFAQALDEQDAEGTGTGVPDGPSDEAEQTMMLAVADGLGTLPRPELDPAVKTVQRAQLIAAMETHFAEGGGRMPEQRNRARKGAHRAPPLGPLSKLRPRSRLSKGLAVGGLTVGVAAGAFSGVAAASTDALPGDTLYGLKRGMEDLKLDLAGGDAERGRVHLGHASTRMNEARRLMERRSSGPLDHESLGAVHKALSAMGNDASEGHRLLRQAYERDGEISPIQTLSSFSKTHRKGWVQLRDQLPVQLHDIGDRVNSVFDAIDQHVTPLRDLLPREPDTSTPEGEPETGDRTGQDEPDSRPSTPSSEGQPSDGRTSGGDQPSPSEPETGQREDDGFLDGPGLLDPPAPEDDSETGTKAPDEPTEPDITIPPLLPGGLPDLGLDVEEDK